jgi:hypothetical protein
MIGVLSNASVPALGRFLRCPVGSATPSERIGVASGWPAVSRGSAAVGVASAGTVGRIVGGGADAGWLWSGRAPDAVGFAGGGTGSFVEAAPGGLFAWVVVVIAVGGDVC